MRIEKWSFTAYEDACGRRNRKFRGEPARIRSAEVATCPTKPLLLLRLHPSPQEAAVPVAAPAASEQTDFNIGEEFGTAKKNLPPAKILLICIAVIAVVAAVWIFSQRPRTLATGSIDDVVTAEIPNQNSTMIAINLSLKNGGKDRFQIHELKVDLDTGGNHYSDDAVPAVDYGRYFQALPALGAHALAPIKLQDSIPPGGEARGTIVVSFPVMPDAVEKRTSLKVSILSYNDPAPLVLTK